MLKRLLHRGWKEIMQKSTIKLLCVYPQLNGRFREKLMRYISPIAAIERTVECVSPRPTMQ